MAEPDLDSYLASRRREIEGELRRRLAPAPGRPPGLGRAMRYAVLGPGKRLRPILTLAAAEVAGGAAARRRALAGGCAIELIHAYSLVHDDLPAMDDDDMRELEKGKVADEGVLAYGWRRCGGAGRLGGELHCRTIWGWAKSRFDFSGVPPKRRRHQPA